ncbi:MAG: DUF3604 domain-containing protein [Myxococcota bacterium]|nr:DUF3604 domain-containing protein [Myxococcota bacterium]
MLRRVLLVLLALIVLAAAGFWLLASGRLGRHEGPGVVTATARPAAETAARVRTVAEAARAAGVPDAKQVLFGDLHVHTTFSTDAFLFSLPALGGEGAHPPADACDFARYCSALDFWSINDHAEGMTPAHWSETIDSIRQCNAVAGSASDPDTVAFLGWEWTQVGDRPETHFGHKNVVLAHTEDARIPARPIASRRAENVLAAPGPLTRAFVALSLRSQRGLELGRYFAELAAREPCPDGVPVRDLPPDCHESTATPGELFAKLDDWGHDALVIPHGTAWGWSAPKGADWVHQMTPEQHDPARQNLVEVFSGHGNAEEYRDWREAELDAAGNRSCPAPSPGYLPGCWQAGELVRARCAAAGESDAECESRAAEARQIHVDAGNEDFLTVPAAQPEDWLDAGQCTDCFLPAFNLVPRMSVQYALARANFDARDAAGRPFRKRMGFIGSSDNHTARPGTGYKEFDRRAAMTDAAGLLEPSNNPLFSRPAQQPEPRAVPVPDPPPGFAGRDTERGVSFLYTGGLVATHAAGRSREAVWDALERREVYATSGDRILLWFDQVNAPDGRRVPMGGETTMTGTPRFEVRAVGAFHQKPGCPESSHQGLTPERLARLCHDECYHPSDERKLITRIEVVRIRPQIRPDEPVGTLVEDPWLRLLCPADPTGCRVAFDDPEFARDGRDTLYYVRAIQEPSPTVNGDTLRCERDAEGRCVRADPCFGDWRTPPDDDCLADAEERAWSSPIWVDWAG